MPNEYSLGLQILVLGGGFKYLLFSPLPGEDSHFDSYFSMGLKPPASCRFMCCVLTCLVDVWMFFVLEIVNWTYIHWKSKKVPTEKTNISHMSPAEHDLWKMIHSLVRRSLFRGHSFISLWGFPSLSKNWCQLAAKALTFNGCKLK